MVTASQYAVLKQSIRNQRIKINLLNFKYQTVDELSGNVISGNVNIDANSDIRRTCSLKLVITDSSFDIKSGGKIWLDKFIQIYVGVDSLQTNEPIWFNYGIYLINAPSWTYDAENNTLSFEGVDLMAKMTGLRNGYLSGVPTVIPQGASVRESMVSTVTQLGGFSKYIIEECRLSGSEIQTVPYDITIDQGGTVYDILVKLRDILPSYEIFFDSDGVFVYRPIPTGENEIVVADDDILKENLISENIITDFESVKNVVEVYGRTLNTGEQVHATAQDDNPNSPFYINSSVGMIRAVYFGGEYDNILTNELCLERAKYNLWLSTRMNDSINLSTVPIHFLDVNQLIKHGIKNSETQEQYIIKSISVDLSESGTQTINAIKYYPLYPTI